MGSRDKPSNLLSDDSRKTGIDESAIAPFLANGDPSGGLRDAVKTFRRAHAALREPSEVERGWRATIGANWLPRDRLRFKILPFAVVFGAVLLPAVLFSDSVGFRDGDRAKDSPAAPSPDAVAQQSAVQHDSRSAGGGGRGVHDMLEDDEVSAADIRSAEFATVDRIDPEGDKPIGEVLADQPQLNEIERYILQDLAGAGDRSPSEIGLDANPQLAEINSAGSEEPAGHSGLMTIQSHSPGPDIRGVSLREPVEHGAASRSSPTYSVQLASLPSQHAARQAAEGFGRDLVGALRGRPMTVERAAVAGGTVFRVRVGSFANRAAAEALCSRLRELEADCLVVQRQPGAGLIGG